MQKLKNIEGTKWADAPSSTIVEIMNASINLDTFKTRKQVSEYINTHFSDVIHNFYRSDKRPPRLTLDKVTNFIKIKVYSKIENKINRLLLEREGLAPSYKDKVHLLTADEVRSYIADLQEPDSIFYTMYKLWKSGKWADDLQIADFRLIKKSKQKTKPKKQTELKRIENAFNSYQNRHDVKSNADKLLALMREYPAHRNIIAHAMRSNVNIKQVLLTIKKREN